VPGGEATQGPAPEAKARGIALPNQDEEAGTQEQSQERLFDLAREMSLAGVVIALGLVVPILFHALGSGAIFLPMYLPILAGAMFLSPGMAALTGVITPLASAALTGMPPLAPPIALMMTAELAVLAAVASLLHRRLGVNPWLTVIGALVAERCVYAAELWLLAPLLHINLPAAAAGVLALVKAWPGLLLQIAIVPPLVAALEARKKS